MIGSQPTIGCIVFLRERTPSFAVQQVLSTLNAALAVECQSRAENKWIIKAGVGTEGIEGLIFALENQQQSAVFIEFDEEKCIQIAAGQRQSLESLFLPYANALKQMPDAIALGIGFEMAIPTSFETHALQDAGIAVLFERRDSKAGWQRHDIYHLTGHTEKPLVGVA